MRMWGSQSQVVITSPKFITDVVIDHADVFLKVRAVGSSFAVDHLVICWLSIWF